MVEPPSDGSPLINAAALWKLRLVRLLVEGGARVNERNPRGETPLLAACKALRGEPAGPQTLKVLAYLLKNKADPNAQDRAGRTPLMYACMERAGAQVTSTLLSSGADPSMEDYSGASALVYAVNARHQPTLQVLLDACRATGRDIIIIATDMRVSGGPVTRRYLNVPPSPDTSPVSCMSPSDIVLKTGSPSSPEGDNVFNFRGTGKSRSSSSRFPPGNLSPVNQSGTPPPRQRMWSEPWLAIHNLARLNRAYEEGGMRERSLQEEREGEEGRREGGDQDNEKREQEDGRIHIHSRMEGRREGVEKENRYGVETYNDNSHEDPPSRVSRSLLSLTEEHQPQAAEARWAPERGLTPGGPTSDTTNWRSSVDKLPPCPSPRWQNRRNTLPSLMVVPPPLQLPPLVTQSESHLQVPSPVSPSEGTRVAFHPRPPNSSPSSSSSLRVPLRPAFLPPLPHTSSVASLVAAAAAPPASLCSERGRRSPRRYSVQPEQIGR